MQNHNNNGKPSEAAGAKTVHGMKRNDGKSLNPRIVEGLNNLYDDILNDPIPDKITSILDKLRDEERKQNLTPSAPESTGPTSTYPTKTAQKSINTETIGNDKGNTDDDA